jgi:hypothetical protein
MKNRKTGEALFLVRRRRTIEIRNSGDAMTVKREDPEAAHLRVSCFLRHLAAVTAGTAIFLKGTDLGKIGILEAP